MCGIIGVFGKDKSLVKRGLDRISYRGKDGEGYFENFGHRLHAVVSNVSQPFKGEGVLVANCEIYNWEELKIKYNLEARNDAELLFRLLELKGVSCLDELDGDYAFAYWRDSKVFLCRDVVGVKPVWYSFGDGFAFASEKKALEEIDYLDIVELNPRIILEYDVESGKLKESKRSYFEIKENNDSYSGIKEKVSSLLEESIVKRFPNQKFGILFSGGLDSTLLAYYAKKHGKDFTCYVAGVDEEAEDVRYARKVAKDLKVDLKVVLLSKDKVSNYLEKVVPLIEDNNVVKVGVGLTFFVALEEISKDGIKVVFSGQGSEEVFGGYQRHKLARDINKEGLAGLRKIYERDLYRDDVVSMFHSVELRVPFLDVKLVDYCLGIPGKYKIEGETVKKVLRDVALDLGISQEWAFRKRKAAQYGSSFDKVIGKLAKGRKSEYLREFYPGRNVKLGVLFSSGKDSSYAAYIMKEQNYDLRCLITVKSENKDSYLFHTPNIGMVDLQAESMGIPLVSVSSEGVKEKELLDLKNALMKAKGEYGIEGIVTGALFSTYQRDRIERVADELGLKVFAPLWHKDQEVEMRELIKKGFDVIISSVASDGLDESFLGRKVDESLLNDLLKINKKTKINLAFEGGEAETLVLDCPLFNSKIKILKAEKEMDGEFSGRYNVIEVKLTKK